MPKADSQADVVSVCRQMNDQLCMAMGAVTLLTGSDFADCCRLPLLLLLLERLQGQCRTGSWRMSKSVRQQWRTCTLQELSRCVWFAAQCNTNRSPIFL